MDKESSVIESFSSYGAGGKSSTKEDGEVETVVLTRRKKDINGESKVCDSK